MAVFTITTAVNADTLAGKGGADTYTITGGSLTIDGDSRYDLNGDPSNGVLGSITTNASTGGDLYIDGRYVRIIYFTGGSGTVPVQGTAITKGGASGVLIGVYSALNVAPTAVGAAMPASGYVKIKQWNSTAYTAGALTGITANVATDPITGVAGDRVGWIEVVGQEATTITINGLSNQSQKLVLGQPMLIGTTPGTPANTDTYQIPTNGNTCWMPGVFVETSAGSGAYEFWPTTSDAALSTKIATDNIRGRYCWVSAAGVLRFQNDGTNSTGGTLPPANCKIVIGNVILNSATSAAKTVNSMNTTPNTRYRWNMGGLSNLEIEWATHNWRWTTNVAKKNNALNSGVFGPVAIQQSGEQVVWTNCGIGTQLADGSILFDLVTCALGGVFTNVTFGKGAFTVTYTQPVRCNASDNVTFDNCRFTHTGDKFSTSSYAIIFLSSSNIEIKNCTIGSNINTSTGSNYWFHDNQYYFSAYGLPGLAATNATSTWNMATISNFMIEDESFPLQYQVPYSALVNISANSADGTVRNIGSYASPIDASGYTEYNATYTRSSTTITVTTSSAHNLRVGDNILIFIADSTGAPASSRAVTAVPTSTTFTFTGVNSGLTSGTISFYVSYTSQVITIGGNNVARMKFQNIWYHGTNGQVLVINSTTNDVQFDNIDTDTRYVAHYAIAGTDVRVRSLGFNTAVPPPGTGVLGTLMESVFTTPLTTTGQIAANWTRSSSTVTFTVTNHGLTSGDYIQMYDSTNVTGAANGFRSVTVLTKDTFTVTGTNTGTTTGTASYRISNARLNIFGNDESPTQPYITVDSGTPKYTGSGTLAALNIGDGITWETPDWIYAFDNFANILPVVSSSTNIIQHMNLYYAIDRGSGYSSFKNLYYQRPGGGGSSASTTVTMTDTTGVVVGDYVYGVGIADGATVQSITNSTDIVVNNANIGTVSGVLIFTHAPSEAQFPTSGVKMKIRFLNFGAPTAAMTYIAVPMLATATTKQNLYPQETPETQSVTLTNGIDGSRVQIYDLTSDTELYNDITTFPFTWTDPAPYVADREIRVRVAWMDTVYASQFIDTVIGTATDTEFALSYRINQVDDDVYRDNAIDGSTITDIEIIDSVLLAEINTSTMSWASLYAYEVYWLFTEDGIREEGQLITAVDQANYLFDDLVVTNITFPEVPLIMTGGYARNKTTLQTIDVFDTAGGRMFNAPDHVVAFSTLGTPVITGDIADVPTASENAAAVWGDNDTYAAGTKGDAQDKTLKVAKFIRNVSV